MLGSSGIWELFVGQQFFPFERNEPWPVSIKSTKQERNAVHIFTFLKTPERLRNLKALGEGAGMRSGQKTGVLPSS